MAVQLFRFRQFQNGGYHLEVWLDPTQTLADGSPDPAYIQVFDYGPPPQGMTQAAYAQQIRHETKLLVQQQQAAPDQGTALPGEGTSL